MPLKADCHPHWFVADVKPNIEKSIVDALSKKGIDGEYEGDFGVLFLLFGWFRRF